MGHGYGRAPARLPADGGSDRADDPPAVVPYDQSWPSRYAGWKARLSAQLGNVAQRVEHVGSTSVPGPAAKPVIDIQVSTADLAAEALDCAPLERVGAQLRYREDQHRYFRPFAGQPWDVHACLRGGSRWERRHLLFRDYLRASTKARAAYAEVKFVASRLRRGDRMGYNAAKTQAILDIMEKAEIWAAHSR